MGEGTEGGETATSQAATFFLSGDGFEEPRVPARGGAGARAGGGRGAGEGSEAAEDARAALGTGPGAQG